MTLLNAIRSLQTTLVETLQRPEYTGDQRCGPCTVVNLLFVAVLGWVASRRSRTTGMFVGGIGVALVYLRGYLVPGTPELTKRHLPPGVLRSFGKDVEPTVRRGVADETDIVDPEPTGAAVSVDGEAAGQGSDAAVLDDETLDLEEVYRTVGVLEPTDDGADLRLSTEFAAAWADACRATAAETVTAADVADAFGFADATATFELEEHDHASVLRKDSTVVGQWPSRAAVVADVAASRTLPDWLPGWESLDVGRRGELLDSLRLFIETCPTSEGTVSTSEETVESCCASQDVFVVTCDETGDRLFEHPVEQLDG